jgi:misacylated tRNA(Ala) deacylase
MFADNPYIRNLPTRVALVEDAWVMTEATLFYPQGGGQPGDRGIWLCEDGRALEILDTRKGDNGQVRHLLADANHGLSPGDRVEQRLDWSRRYRHMQLHTAMHLLCSVVGCGVTGGQLTADKARIDFDAGERTLDRGAIEAGLNALIERDLAVLVEEVDEAELERDPGLVKTLSVQPPRGTGRLRLIHIPDVDRQPCGGTHVARTGEIRPLVIRRIESKGARNKRVVIGWRDPEEQT